ncbi:MAG: hypothetical protein ACJ0BJ_05565 [Pirellulales bacterium]
MSCGPRVRCADHHDGRDEFKRGRLAISRDHQEYALLVAEAFDHLATCKGDMRIAGEVLQVTPTQLVNLFRKDSAVWTAFQTNRVSRGLRPLK